MIDPGGVRDRTGEKINFRNREVLEDVFSRRQVQPQINILYFNIGRKNN